MLAFVEQDEKDMNRKKKKSQLAILAAGPFSNFMFGILFILLFLLFLNLSVHPTGILYASTAINATSFKAIFFNETSSTNYFTKENISQIQNISQDTLPDKFILETSNDSYIITKDLLFAQLSAIEKPENQTIKVYYDAPAINANLEGEILKIDGISVTDENIFTELKKTVPYQQVEIITTKQTYEITAIPSPLNNSKGFHRNCLFSNF